MNLTTALTGMLPAVVFVSALLPNGRNIGLPIVELPASDAARDEAIHRECGAILTAQ